LKVVIYFNFSVPCLPHSQVERHLSNILQTADSGPTCIWGWYTQGRSPLPRQASQLSKANLSTFPSSTGRSSVKG